MSTLHLIRHAQASFGAEDYDVLSDLGRHQAALLGEELARSGLQYDAIYTGPRKRQIDTAALAIAASRSAGTDQPEPTPVDEFDEYPAFELFKRWVPAVQGQTPLKTAMTAAPAERGALIWEAIKQVAHAWSSGELDTGELESFEQFDTRVCSGLDRVMSEQGRNKTFAVVTSGGPISIGMRRALGLQPTVTLKVTWAIVNSSTSEFRYRDDEFSLTGFNRIEHLRDPALVTHR